jgi:hypothetical protein
MRHLLTAALIAVFALSFTMAQDQPAKQEKSTTTSAKSTAKPAGCCKASKGCCADSKEAANMKDCQMMKGTDEASNSGSTEKKTEPKTAETKPAETK